MKLLVVLLLVALCLSMLYVVAAYAIAKGQAFAFPWLVIFSATVVVDVGVRQTIEAVVIFYTIPDLVASQVESVEAALRRQAQALVMQEECKPKGIFYPLSVWKEMFGTVYDAATRHTVVKVNGIDGVVVPGANMGKAWEMCFAILCFERRSSCSSSSSGSSRCRVSTK